MTRPPLHCNHAVTICCYGRPVMSPRVLATIRHWTAYATILYVGVNLWTEMTDKAYKIGLPVVEVDADSRVRRVFVKPDFDRLLDEAHTIAT